MFAMGPAFFKQAGASYAPLAITGAFASGTVGTAYSSSLPITGGMEPYSLTGGTGVAAGSLDSGFSLSITGSAGDFSLTLACASPTTAGTMSFTVSVDSSDAQTATSAQSVAIAAAATGYAATVAAMNPGLWWKLEETTGTTAADSTAGTTHDGALTGGATFADTGVSVTAPTGFSGLGRGVDFSASGVTDIHKTTTDIPWGHDASSWSVVLWVAGSAKASQYLVSRINDAAIIYQFVSDKVEFFSGSFTGSDPRPGSQISLAASDTSTPHLIVYRYDTATSTWSGWLDNAEVFNVTRSFDCGIFNGNYLGSDSTSGNSADSKMWDHQLYLKYLSDTELGALWAARDST